MSHKRSDIYMKIEFAGLMAVVIGWPIYAWLIA